MTVLLPEPRFLLVVAALFLVGAGLIRVIHGVHHVPIERRRLDWVKYGVYVALINGLWASAFIGWGMAVAALSAVVLAGAVEIFLVVQPRVRVPVTAFAAASATACVAAVALMLFTVALYPMLGSRATGWQGHFAFVVMVTASTDSFSELSGRLVGRHQLCPRLSPGKTVEGLLVGVTMAVGVALTLGFLTPWAPGAQLAFVGLVTAVGAVVGDLAFSAIKRRAGVKDFSGLLPGHGGVLDRFDSLLGAAPAFYLADVLWSG